MTAFRRPPDVGLTAADISRADAVLVGHSHFDHIAGAEVIAANTGAPVIGSNESARVLLEAGISEDLCCCALKEESGIASPPT